MTKSVARLLSRTDQLALARLAENLPQSLIIEAEPGLDAVTATELLLGSTQTELYRIAPEEGKSQIGVEQVRIALSRLHTYTHTRRIIIIDPADSMTPNAQTALLKTLEEPNSGLHFILISHGEDALLPTIYSRCQIHRMSRTSSAQDRDIIGELGLDAPTMQQILFLASGRPLLLRQLATNTKLFSTYQSTASAAKAIISASGYARLQALAPYFSRREDAQRLMDILLSMLHFQLSQGATSPQIHSLIDDATKADASLQHNGNTRLALLRLV